MSESKRINNQITAKELRIIGDDGKSIGVMSTHEALVLAKDRGLDLIEISPSSPIAKIMDLGKFLYEQKKKDKKKSGGHKTETKSLQVKIGTGEHDLSLKSKKISEFLREGHRVKLDLFLPGRAKYLDKTFLEERLNRVLVLVDEPYRLSDGPQKSPKGLTVIIERGSKKQNEDE